LSERGRELASLRVLGFTRGEVRTMLFGEQAVVTLAGIPLSFVIGRVCAAWLMSLFAAERHRFPAVVNASTYAIAALVVLTAAIGAALAIRRRLDGLDLVAVLKTRE
jgi:putative ABC transport system permease protein